MIQIIGAAGSSIHGKDDLSTKGSEEAKPTDYGHIVFGEMTMGFWQQLLREISKIGVGNNDGKGLQTEACDPALNSGATQESSEPPLTPTLDAEATSTFMDNGVTPANGGRVDGKIGAEPADSKRLDEVGIARSKHCEKVIPAIPKTTESKQRPVRPSRAEIESGLAAVVSFDSPTLQMPYVEHVTRPQSAGCRTSGPQNVVSGEDTAARSCGAHATSEISGTLTERKPVRSSAFPVGAHGLDSKTCDSSEANLAIAASVSFGPSRILRVGEGEFSRSGQQSVGTTGEPSPACNIPRSLPLNSSKIAVLSAASSSRTRHQRLSAIGNSEPSSAVNGADVVMPAAQNSFHAAAAVAGTIAKAISGAEEQSWRNGSGAPEPSSRVVDVPPRCPEQWTHAGLRFAEAGFQDPSFGWISVRAARDNAGLHAVVVPPSAEAVHSLSAHLDGLNAYLGHNQIPVSTVTLSTFETDQYPAGSGADSQRQASHNGSHQGNEHHREPTVTIVDLHAQSGSRDSIPKPDEYSLSEVRKDEYSRRISLVA